MYTYRVSYKNLQCDLKQDIHNFEFVFYLQLKMLIEIFFFTYFKHFILES